MKLAPFSRQEAALLATKYNHLYERVYLSSDGRPFTVSFATYVPYGENHNLELTLILSDSVNNPPGDEYAVLNYIKKYEGEKFDVLLFSLYENENGKLDIESIPIQLISRGNELDYGFNLPWL
jgi:hypothetical protein